MWRAGSGTLWAACLGTLIAPCLATLLAVGLCAPAAALTADGKGGAHIENPRAFGHFIGDPLDRSIEITVPPGFALAPQSLPKPQRQGAWLELQSVRPQSTVIARGVRVRLDLHYQLVNSPDKLLQTALPGMSLHFTDGAGSFDTVIDAFPILVSPLARGSPDPGLAMRPSRAPVPIDAVPSRALLFAAVAAALLCLAAANARRLAALIHGSGTRPFERAHRTLRELAAAAPGIERQRVALRAVHRAFDETAGAPVFADRLDAFFETRPAFAASRAAVRDFYAASRTAFFSAGDDRGNDRRNDRGNDRGDERDERLRLERLVSLCAQLRACERRAQG